MLIWHVLSIIEMHRVLRSAVLAAAQKVERGNIMTFTGTSSPGAASPVASTAHDLRAAVGRLWYSTAHHLGAAFDTDGVTAGATSLDVHTLQAQSENL